MRAHFGTKRKFFVFLMLTIEAGMDKKEIVCVRFCLFSFEFYFPFLIFIFCEKPLRLGLEIIIINRIM